MQTICYKRPLMYAKNYQIWLTRFKEKKLCQPAIDLRTLCRNYLFETSVAVTVNLCLKINAWQNI